MSVEERAAVGEAEPIIHETAIVLTHGLHDLVRNPKAQGDFGWALAHTAGIPQFSDMFVGLTNFYETYERKGLSGAIEAATEADGGSGAWLSIIHPTQEGADEQVTWGRLIGITGYGQTSRTFWGVAIVDPLDGMGEPQVSHVHIDLSAPYSAWNAGVVDIANE